MSNAPIEKATLAKCPFCDGEPSMDHQHVTHGHGEFGILHYVCCTYCRARGPAFDETREENAVQAAIVAWNRRP